MSRMKITITGSDGTELLEVPFGTDHIAWVIRNNGYFGRITEQLIAEYVASLIWKAGQDWERQKNEWIATLKGSTWTEDKSIQQVSQEVQAKINKVMSWEPYEGYNDDGTIRENAK